MNMFMRGIVARLGVAVLLTGLALGAATASAQSSQATAFVRDLGNRAIAQLTDDSIGEQERRERFRALLNDGFDIGTIGRFVLGRYWRSATADQQSEFLNVFEEVIVQRFTPLFANYEQKTFDMCQAPRTSNPAVELVCTRLLTTDGELVQVLWQVEQLSAGQQITDVVVEGVSMRITLQSEYRSVIQQNGGDVSALIDGLKRKLNI